MTEAKRVPSVGKDDRNFRSQYLEKIGFRGVDQRKELELLWQEDPLKTDMFSNFALKHSLPSCDRLSVWKVILGVAPRYAKNKEQNWKWKRIPYEDSLRFMKSAGRIQTEAIMPKAQIQSIIWLLFDGHLKFDYESQLTEFWPRNFSAISETMFKIYESQNRTNADVEVFYLSQGLANLLKRFSSNDIITEAIQSFLHILSTNQGTSNIYPHLDKIGLTQGTEPFRTWFSRGFAGVLNTPALEKIWDKVIGGSLKILVFAAVALIESCKMALLTCQTSQEAVRCLTATSEETDEMIAQTAIEMWIDDGCQIYFEKQIKSNDVKGENTLSSHPTPISNNETIDLIEPNFAMSTMIRILPSLD